MEHYTGLPWQMVLYIVSFMVALGLILWSTRRSDEWKKTDVHWLKAVADGKKADEDLKRITDTYDRIQVLYKLQAEEQAIYFIESRKR